jgi:DNA modification methylase
MSDQELHNLRLAIEDCGFKVSSYLVWIKNNHVLGRKDYSSKHEIVLYGWKDKHKFYGEFSTTVLEYDKPLKNEFHPTMKPVELVQRIIADGSPKGGVIFDSFLGSGTTLIAAETMEGNRSVYGFEISPHYCEVIMQRFSKITGEEPVLITTI